MIEAQSSQRRTDHPRPLLRRAWWSLDGVWDFAVDPSGDPDAVSFATTITVPFAPGTPASGVPLVAAGASRFWYRRRAALPPAGGQRTLLHFGAVDHEATVWVNGVAAGSHEGGYVPFTLDVTELVAGDGADVEIVVRADDPPADLTIPRGKQDWRDVPHAVWYPRTNGIWRTVWVERVPQTYVANVDWRCDVSAMTVTARVTTGGRSAEGTRLRIAMSCQDRALAEVEVTGTDHTIEVTIPVGDGSMDDRSDLMWWPRRPVILDATLSVVSADGKTVDRAASYTALRSVDVFGGKFRVNGLPVFLRMVLDQGYWPESGATPPDVAALRCDIERTRELGFNAARKHQKTEDPRYFAIADEVGLMVWVEMPSAYLPGAASARHLVCEWVDVVASHRNHPSVVAWVPVNESWGVPGLAQDRSQRATAEALAAIAKSADGTRPVSVNDGWETTGGEIVGIHDYSQDPEGLRLRYAHTTAVEAIVTGTGTSGKSIDLDGRPPAGRAVILSEFGGVALADGPEGTWGYTTAASSEDLLDRYRAQWAAVRASTALAGACWTQLTDTYQEANGLLRADRTPKAPLEQFAKATTGRD